MSYYAQWDHADLDDWQGKDSTPDEIDHFDLYDPDDSDERDHEG